MPLPSRSTASDALIGLWIATGLASTWLAASLTSSGVAILAAIWLSPLLEEGAFRGVAWDALQEWSPEVRLTVTSLGFGLLHPLVLGGASMPWQNWILATLVFSTFGLVFGLARHRIGLVGAIALHGWCNALFYLLPGGWRQQVVSTLL